MKNGKYIMNKCEVLEWFTELPTTKTSHMIVRQKGHPLGDWTVEKPTRKHKYLLTIKNANDVICNGGIL